MQLSLALSHAKKEPSEYLFMRIQLLKYWSQRL